MVYFGLPDSGRDLFFYSSGGVMKSNLETFGNTLQVQAHAIVPAGGASSIFCDLPNGPVDPKHIWIVEYASFSYSDLGGRGGPGSNWDTISVVAVGSAPVQDPPSAATAPVDFQNRGIILPVGGGNVGGGAVFNEFLNLTERGYVIPYGATLRASKSASVASGAAEPLTEGMQLIFNAVVRVIDLCACE
jgi:hypothetical protein